MVSTRILISKSSSSCTNPLVTVLYSPITIGIIVTIIIIIIIIIIICSLLRVFHTSVSWWFLIEVWQQVLSSLQDSSQYSGRFQ